MKQYFNINLEFNTKVVDCTIKKAILDKKKGYVCVIDGNVLATTHVDFKFREIINNGLVNLCDGSSIALLAGKIHKQKFNTYTGPDIFAKYVNENYKQYFLGNTKENLDRIKNRFTELGYDIARYKFESLPYKNVEDFDYITIAKNINSFSPDIIWVSLGAPKQEIFISNLYPFIDRGILFAIGAAFNIYLGDLENKRTSSVFRRIHLEWLFRIFKEPKKQIGRVIFFLKYLPAIVFEELKKKKESGH